MCIDDVLRTPAPPAAPTAKAVEDAGPSMVYSPSGATGEELLSLTETAARLKQLELESSPRLTRNNVNINMVMNNQEDIVKLREKCCLNSAGSSPVVTPLRTPGDLKSNILKAQAEAATLKVGLEEHVTMMGDKNCNLQETSFRLKSRTSRMGSSNSSLSVSSRPDIQDSWELLKSSSMVSSAGTSAERLAEDLNPLPLKLSSDPVVEGTTLKVKGEEVDVPNTTSPLPDNLIDFTDPIPTLPPVQSPKASITPRWIIPTAAPPGIFTNGLLDLEPPTKVDTFPPADGGAALTSALPYAAHTFHSNSVSIMGQQAASEDGVTPRGLLTTEL